MITLGFKPQANGNPRSRRAHPHFNRFLKLCEQVVQFVQAHAGQQFEVFLAPDGDSSAVVLLKDLKRALEQDTAKGIPANATGLQKGRVYLDSDEKYRPLYTDRVVATLAVFADSESKEAVPLLNDYLRTGIIVCSDQFKMSFCHRPNNLAPEVAGRRREAVKALEKIGTEEAIKRLRRISLDDDFSKDIQNHANDAVNRLDKK